MKEKLIWAANLGLFMATTLLLCLFQTTVWFDLFGTVPSPYLWISPLVYLSLYRKPLEAILVIYCLGTVVATFTLVHLGFVLLSSLVVFAMVNLLKNRVYWPGPRYFVTVCGGAVIVFHVSYFVFSWLLETKPLTSPEFASWMLSSLLTALLVWPTYFLFLKVDKLTFKEHLIENRDESAYGELSQ